MGTDNSARRVTASLGCCSTTPSCSRSINPPLDDSRRAGDSLYNTIGPECNLLDPVRPRVAGWCCYSRADDDASARSSKINLRRPAGYQTMLLADSMKWTAVRQL
jgi:hypothetical protein